MRMLAKTCVMLGVCLVVTGSALAGSAPRRSVGRSSLEARAAQRTKAMEMLRPVILREYMLGAQSAEQETAAEPEPFVAVSIPDKPLYLGEVCGPRLQEVEAQVTAHVVANCSYHISASFEGLRHQRSNTEISSEHMTVAINGKQVSVGTGRVPIASQGPTPPGGVDVPLELQVGVTAIASYPAGRYSGNLVITVTAGH